MVWLAWPRNPYGLRALTRGAHAVLEVLHGPVCPAVNVARVQQLSPPLWRDLDAAFARFLRLDVANGDA